MNKINIGLTGLLLIIFILVYQNIMISKFNYDLELRLDYVENLLEDMDNDIHDLKE